MRALTLSVLQLPLARPEPADNIAAVAELVEKAAVWLGTADTVPLVLAQDLRLTLPRRVWRRIKLTAVYEGPVTTPIRRGQKLGQLRISGPSMPVINRPLLAGRDVDQLGVIKRIGAAISFLVWGE